MASSPPARSTENAPGAAPAATPGAAPERCLGLPDKGIWSDLDPQVQLTLPEVPADRVSATVDRKRGVLVLLVDGFPHKAYPLTGRSKLKLGPHELALRPGDHAELAPRLTAARISTRPAVRDRDRDGIPDPLDILIGAKKTVLNADAYTEGYVVIPYPLGDVPRTMGVCTDVVIRAIRNAGLDLQQALHEDLLRAPKAYPMVAKRGGNANIDHRRVATLLPYFKRHWEPHTAAIDDPADPLRPGDVIFMDTLARPGPDHIGIVSDRVNDHGQPLIINNWTNGTVTAEMDLLTFVPVLYRFRLPSS